MPKSRAAFTLTELLVVIVIVGVLASVALPVISSVQLQGKKVQSLNNLRQLGTALALYTGQNNGALPTEGESNPTWASSTQPTDANSTAWYNVLPQMGNFPALSSFANNPADFYTKRNLLFVPAAVYPSTKKTAPLFAVSFCSKIYMNGITSALMQSIAQPSHLVVFQESGVPGEKNTFNVKSAFNGQSKSYATCSIGRYSGKTLLVFADGHADSMVGTDLVDPTSHQAYFPQSNGKVIWTIDPTADPN